jgi:hypothetical protein
VLGGSLFFNKKPVCKHKPLTNGPQKDQRTGFDVQPRFSKSKEPALNHLIFDDTCGFF